MKILVTSVGGDIGYTIVRILRGWERSTRIIGTDIHSDHAGVGVVDSFYEVPHASKPEYLEVLTDIAAREQVDIIIPVSEDEIRRLTSEEVESQPIVKNLLTLQTPFLEKCFDKLLCIELVRSYGLSVPWTVPALERPLAFPCILKNRIGSGSRGVRVLEDEKELAMITTGREKMIFQELLLPSDREYTCCVFRSRIDLSMEIIVLHRRLMGGLTGSAVVVLNEEIETYCRQIAESLQIAGSMNIQLILTNEGPKLFEINPRFSSTAGFRHHLGFRDVIWSIQEARGEVFGKTFDRSSARGRKFYRVFSEIYS